MGGEFVILVKHGGLGDHLFFSHLPRIAKTSGGFDRVLISKCSEFRHPSYAKLVWELNPYVDGFTDEAAPYPEFEVIAPGMNLLDRLMLERGLDDGKRFHEPEVHYRPKRLAFLKDKTVFDPNFVSGVGDVSQKLLEDFFSAEGTPDYQLKPGQRSCALSSAKAELTTKSLFHYCDIIHSCGRFYCLASGGATLAAALGKPATVFFGRGQKDMFHHSKLHRYVNISSTAVAQDMHLLAPHLPQGVAAELTAFREELAQWVDPRVIKVALDLGSRDGQVALAFREFFPEARIFAFECNPDALLLCRKRLDNQLRITLVEKAVSDEMGQVDFFAVDPARTITPHPDGNIGASSLFPAAPDYPFEHYVQRRVSVQATPLADWATQQGLDAIDLLWMDIQGAELKALRGMGKLLATVKAIYTEVAYRPIYINQPLAAELNAFLLKHGFAMRKILYRDEWMGNLLYTRCELPVIEVQAAKAGQDNKEGQPQCSDLVPTKAATDKEVQISICIITNSGLPGQEKRRKGLDRLLASIPLAGFPINKIEIIVAGATGRPLDGIKAIEMPQQAASGQVCALRNAAANAATGTFIIHCDDDVLFTAGYWQAVSGMLDQDWDILCTRLLNPNGTRYWDWAAYYPEKGQTLLPYDVTDSHVFATGGHAIYRKPVFQKVRWNEDILHGGNEEFDLAAKAREAGLKYAICPQATVFLQSHHCDALAVVTRQPHAADTPCAEFNAVMSKVESILRPAASQVADSGLRSRLQHKLAKANASNSVAVSILVGCYRYLRRFRVFAQSVLGQDYDLDRVELIVANPHSPDGLSSLLEVLSRDWDMQVNGRRKGPHIKEVLIDEKYHRNRGYMIQRAFEQSRGEVVIGMDCDMVVPPNFLSRIVSGVRANPDRVVGVYRNFLTPETTDAIIASRVNPLTQFGQLLNEDVQERQGYRGVLGYCQAVTRKAWEAVGYPEEFDEIAKSDVGFIERLAKIGVKPLFFPELKILHLHHARNWQGTEEFL